MDKREKREAFNAKQTQENEGRFEKEIQKQQQKKKKRWKEEYIKEESNETSDAQ